MEITVGMIRHAQYQRAQLHKRGLSKAASKITVGFGRHSCLLSELEKFAALTPSAPTGAPQSVCGATTKKGTPCKNGASCKVHNTHQEVAA
jgi:hypothetical protein